MRGEATPREMAKDGAMPVGDSGPDDLETVAERLKVLANAKRLHLLRFLTKPHYLEEIASELMMARQTAQEHVQKLLDAGLVEKVQGRRDHGPVTDYVIVPQRIFALHEELGKLTSLESDLEKKEDSRPVTMPLKATTGGIDPKMLNRLSIVHGLRIGQTLSLSGGGPWLIGRDAASTLNLDYDPYVSNRHAEVRRGERGLELVDLYSSNGTYVDWERLGRGGTKPVANGSLIRVGRTLLLLRTA